MKLELLNVDCGYKGYVVLSKVNFTVETGEVVYVLGPNGSGKTTLFKAIQRHIRDRKSVV